ncbi:MAG: hypothetical protein KDD70_02800 [Bdellovibrionales bacterium]|nr:hypothetical protein [Bdellovibrionales bacterium]
MGQPALEPQVSREREKLAAALYGELICDEKLSAEEYRARASECADEFLAKIVSGLQEKFQREDSRSVRFGVGAPDDFREEHHTLGLQLAARSFNPEGKSSFLDYLRNGYFLSEWADLELLREAASDRRFSGEVVSLPGTENFTKLLQHVKGLIPEETWPILEKVFIGSQLLGLGNSTILDLYPELTSADMTSCFVITENAMAALFPVHTIDMATLPKVPDLADPTPKEVRSQVVPELSRREVSRTDPQPVTLDDERAAELDRINTEMLQQLAVLQRQVSQLSGSAALESQNVELLIEAATEQMIGGKLLPEFERDAAVARGVSLAESDPTLSSEQLVLGLRYLYCVDGADTPPPAEISSRPWAQAKRRYLQMIEQDPSFLERVVSYLYNPAVSTLRPVDIVEDPESEVLDAIHFAVGAFTPDDIELTAFTKGVLERQLQFFKEKKE